MVQTGNAVMKCFKFDDWNLINCIVPIKRSSLKEKREEPSVVLHFYPITLVGFSGWLFYNTDALPPHQAQVNPTPKGLDLGVGMCFNDPLVILMCTQD